MFEEDGITPRKGYNSTDYNNPNAGFQQYNKNLNTGMYGTYTDRPPSFIQGTEGFGNTSKINAHTGVNRINPLYTGIDTSKKVAAEVKTTPETKDRSLGPDAAASAGSLATAGLTAAGESITDFNPNDREYSDKKVAMDAATGALASAGGIALTALVSSAPLGPFAFIPALIAGGIGYLGGKKKQKIAKENNKQHSKQKKFAQVKEGKELMARNVRDTTSSANLLYGNGPGTKPNAPVGTLQGYGNYINT